MSGIRKIIRTALNASYLKRNNFVKCYLTTHTLPNARMNQRKECQNRNTADTMTIIQNICKNMIVRNLGQADNILIDFCSFM